MSIFVRNITGPAIVTLILSLLYAILSIVSLSIELDTFVVVAFFCFGIVVAIVIFFVSKNQLISSTQEVATLKLYAVVMPAIGIYLLISCYASLLVSESSRTGFFGFSAAGLIIFMGGGVGFYKAHGDYIDRELTRLEQESNEHN